MPIATKMLSILKVFAFSVLAFVLATISFGQGLGTEQAPAPARNRITRQINQAQTVRLAGNVHRFARPEYDQGPVDASMLLQHVVIVFKSTATQRSEIEDLLAQQHTASSANYHRWLSPEEFRGRFGLSQADVDKVKTWLAGEGFHIDETSRGGSWVAFTGSAQQVQKAFGTQTHRYVVNGEPHYANASEPSVPAALADVVLGFQSLDDFRPVPRALKKRTVAIQPNFTSNVSGNHFIVPADFTKIYNIDPLYSAGINGSGQKIAVMGQTNITMSDVTSFRSLAGLPPNDPQLLLVPGSTDPQVKTADVQEADLDIEWAGAVAPNATILYVYSTNVFTSMAYAIDQNLAPVISISYGLCEQHLTPVNVDTFVRMTQQANAQGITIVAATGDSGAADCDQGAIATQGLAVDVPASLPYVTAIGGTEFDEGIANYWNATNTPAPNGGSAISYIPEKAWNDSAANGNLSAGGGGKSILFPKPSWQTGAGVPNDNARDVPDVSIDASADHDGYLICTQGSCVTGYRKTENGSLTVFGGTSMGVPTFAGMMALVNQQTSLAQGNVGTGQGNVNYVLYPLSANSTNIFHDVTLGNNSVPCQPASTPDCPAGGSGVIGYQAAAGYDLATGLGSINVYNLVTTWPVISSTTGTSPDFQLAVSPSSLTVPRGTAATAQVTLTGINGLVVTGTPNFSCSVGAGLTGVGCSIQPAALPNVWTLTITAPAAGSSRHWPAAPWRDVRGIQFARQISGELEVSLGALLAIAVLLTHRLGFANNRSRPRLGGGVAITVLRQWMPLVAFVCVAAFGLGCAGSSKGNSAPASNNAVSTSPMSGTVAVQGANAGMTHTVQMSVTVI